MTSSPASATQLERARDLITHATRVVSFSGAGLSAESGIPTFRDAQEGLWAKYDPMDLASPQGFARDAQMVIDWYNWRRTLLAKKEPNAAHRALAAREDILNVTQNVDHLLECAGVPVERIIHLHGRISADRCNASGCEHREEVDLAAPPGRRDCPVCGGAMRPAVVWFGESLPPDAWERAAEACRECDVLLVIGTSASVYPAAGLIGMAHHIGAKVVVVNRDPSDASHLADVELLGHAGDLVPRII